ncbi:armadillo-type fold-containing protein [Tolypothrix sp. VBCCA 56010]|uniref:armadillo-type fold-containing protein n=1 Tax=Tolypothrix sp. VBCCA 56010 TaxID=3137731 RepID=UPI003D7D56A4
MAQASSSWQQLLNLTAKWSLLFKTERATKQPNFKLYREPGGYLGFLTIVIAMLLWNWKLLLAIIVGIGIMVLVYSMQRWDWRSHWSEIRKLFNSPNRRLALSVTSGGIATFSTYMAATIWVDSNSRWIAAGAILQALGTLLTIILLVWQIVSFYSIREEEQLDRLLLTLTEQDPLKRLIALRRLTKFVNNNRIDSSVKQNIIECLRLLISREEEVMIREAAFESLQALDLGVCPKSPIT